MDILRLRRYFKNSEKIREQWNNKNFLNKFDKGIKAFAKFCLLPDKTYFSVIKYLI